MHGKCLWFSSVQCLKDTATVTRSGFNSVSYCIHLQTAKAESPEVKCINEPVGRPWGLLHTFSFSITAMLRQGCSFLCLPRLLPSSLPKHQAYQTASGHLPFKKSNSYAMHRNASLWISVYGILRDLYYCTWLLFPSFKFPFYSLSPSNNQTTAVYKIKAASS